MTSEDRRTPEEEVLAELMEVGRKILSEEALALLNEAYSAAYAENLVRSYCYVQPEVQEVTISAKLHPDTGVRRSREVVGHNHGGSPHVRKG